MILDDRLTQIEITPGLDGLSTEEKLYLLYDRYFETGDESYLGDISLNAERLAFGIAYNRLLNPNSCFNPSDFLDYLQDIAIKLVKKLRDEYKDGKRQKNIVYTIRRFYSLDAIDAFRASKSQQNDNQIFSLDALNEGPDGDYVEKIGDEDDYFSEVVQLAKEKAALCRTIVKMYIDNMMGSDTDPPKPMALCYARILYQLELRFDGDKITDAVDKLVREDKRKDVSDDRKLTDAVSKIQNPRRTNAPAWALERMGCQDLWELCTDSAQSIQNLFDAGLFWKPAYLKNLLEVSDFDGEMWKNIIFTERYSTKVTSAWANSMHAMVVDALIAQIQADTDLDHEVMRLITPLKVILEKAERRHSRGTPDER